MNQYFDQARWFGPTVGRFSTRDPIGFRSADADLYRFAGNNPVNSLDPTGTSALLGDPRMVGMDFEAQAMQMIQYAVSQGAPIIRTAITVAAGAIAGATQFGGAVITGTVQVAGLGMTAIGAVLAIPVAPVVGVVVVGAGVVIGLGMLAEYLAAGVALAAALQESARLDMIRINMAMTEMIPTMISMATLWEANERALKYIAVAKKMLQTMPPPIDPRYPKWIRIILKLQDKAAELQQGIRDVLSQIARNN